MSAAKSLHAVDGGFGYLDDSFLADAAGPSPPRSVLGDDSASEDSAVDADVAGVSREDALFSSIKLSMLGATNMGFYQADYSTKMGEVVGDLFAEQAIRVGRLRREVDEDGSVKTDEDLLEVCRRMLIRLETSSNRASLKKLSEMMF